MWISHFAPGLILSRWAPQTPLSLLCLAGALPDATFFVLALLGIEGIKYKDKSEELLYTNPTGGSGSSCFPYDCDYPYTHSLVGEIVIGLVFAALVTVVKGLNAKSFAAIFIATMTHYPLDLAVHRHDVAITPGEPISQRHGFPLFDYPWAVFISDLGLFLIALYFHARTSNPGATQANKDNAAKTYLVATVLATVIQADFSFFGAPTKQPRWVHGPIFFVEILGIAFGLGKLNDIVDAGRGGRQQAMGKKAA